MEKPIDKKKTAESGTAEWMTHPETSKATRFRTRYRLGKRALNKVLRLWLFRALLRGDQYSQRARRAARRTLRAVSPFMATLIASALSGLLLATLPADTKLPLKLSEVSLASAGIIGTALALVLTLSLVPAQKAADVFSAAVLQLYARDRQLHGVVGLLSLLVLVSLLLATGWDFGVSARYLTVGQVVGLGAALDALRKFYARTLDLLMPAKALDLVYCECCRTIDKTKRRIDRLVDIHRLTGGAAPEWSDAAARWTFYSQSRISEALSIWIEHLQEFAHKAVSRQDTQAANGALRTLAAIGTKYAESRRGSLVVVPEFSGVMFVPASDVSNVLNPIYEAVKSTCESAVRQPNELVVRGCIVELGNLAAHAMKVVADEGGFGRSSPLAFAPVFYLNDCTKRAAEAAMDDALLASINGLAGVFKNISRDVQSTEVETSALDGLFDIALSCYPRRATVPCIKAVEMMLAGVNQNLRVRGYERVSHLRPVLTKLSQLIPFEVVLDNVGERRSQIFPAYNLSFPSSLPAILAYLANQVAVDEDRPRVDPYDDFTDASELIVHHYRDVAKNVDFGGALLQKWMLNSIFELADVHLHLLKHPTGEPGRFLEGVNNRLIWFIHIPAGFFKRPESFHQHYADDAAGQLAVLGMRLLRLGRLDGTMECGKAIAAIATYSIAAKPFKPFGTADVLVSLECLKRASAALGYATLAQTFAHQSAVDVPEPLKMAVEEALRNRIGFLQEEIDRCDRDDLMQERPATLLKRILEEVRKR